MKTNFRRLQLLLRFVFDANDFYVIGFRDSDVSLQGHISSKLVEKCKRLKMESTLEDGWITFKRGMTTITLTF